MKGDLRTRARVREAPRYRGATSARPLRRNSILRDVLEMAGRLPWLELGAALIIALGAGLLPWAAARLLGAVDPQISRIRVTGDFHGLNRQVLKKDLSPFLDRSFFATDLSEVKRFVESQPWVASAAVTRVWPDALRVDVVERKPIAYWNDGALINPAGRVFRPGNIQAAGALPHLYGPAGRSAEVLGMASRLSHSLSRLGLGLASLHLAARGAWTLELADGVRVALGTDDVSERFQRFVTVYEQALKTRMNEVASVDARYSNGVAVQWKQKTGDRVGAGKG